MMGHIVRSRAARLLVAGTLLLFVVPVSADAHAELATSTPADGATVTSSPGEISATYSEAMTTAGSSLKLLDASAAVLATGGVDPSDDTRMAITPVPELPAGTYTVRSTTTSADDGDIDRKTWTFTVVAIAPTPVCTDECGPSASPTSPPSAGPTQAPSASAVPTAVTPTPSASAVPTAGGSGGDVVIPIVAAVAILVVAAIWFSRRGRRSPGA